MTTQANRDEDLKALRIAVVGAGIAGLAAMLWLRRGGHDVQCFEQRERDDAGGGLLLSPAGLDALQALGLAQDALALGARIDCIHGATRTGRTVMDLHYAHWRDEAFGLGLQRSALHGVLRIAGQHAMHACIKTRIVDVDAERGVLVKDDGTQTCAFDLIVAADGASSRLRSALPLRVRRTDYTWGAWLCLLDAPAESEPVLLQHYDGMHQVAVWPVGRCEHGEPARMNLSWRVPLATHRDPCAHGLQAWKRDVTRTCPSLAVLLRQITGLDDMAVASYREVSMPRWHYGRVVLIGDAAHASSPQLGQGASHALLDASALALALQDASDVPQALQRFERERVPHVHGYQRLSRWLTPVLQSDTHTSMLARDVGLPALGRVPAFKRAMLRAMAGDGVRP